MKESMYSEQPFLSKNLKYLLLIDTADTTGKRMFMSSYSTLNQQFARDLIFGNVMDASSDTDGDGFIDQYRISFELMQPMTSNYIHNINIWLIFPFELRQQQHISMETLALISFTSDSLRTSDERTNVTMYGQLKFEQKQAIGNSGSNSIYNTSIIDDTSSSTVNIDSILDNYFARKFYTTYRTNYVSMTTHSLPISKTLIINGVVNIGRQWVRYVPGFWQRFKWGWIQYTAVLVPFIFIFNRLKQFVFTNQLVRTWILSTKTDHQE
jgi:transmembrane protein 231